MREGASVCVCERERERERVKVVCLRTIRRNVTLLFLFFFGAAEKVGRALKKTFNAR